MFNKILFMAPLLYQESLMRYIRINASLSNVPIWHGLYHFLHRATAYISRAIMPPPSMGRRLRRFFLRHHGKSQYIFLTRNQNPELFTYLDRQGFFGFHITNRSAEIASLHQIIAFFFCGGQKAFRGCHHFTCEQFSQEIHHIDGNTLNCTPGNLVYLTTRMHKIVTAHQSGAFEDLPGHHWTDLSDEDTPIWNRQGKAVRCKARFLINILARTLKATHQWVHNCKGYLLGIVQWVNRIISYLGAGLDTTYIPNPVFIPYDQDPFRET